MSLPLGGSLSLPPSSTPLGDLAPIKTGSIYSSFLPTSAGDGPEKSDQFVQANEKPPAGPPTSLKDKLSDSGASNWNKPNLGQELQQTFQIKPSVTNAFSDWHKPNIDKLLPPGPLQSEVLELDKRMETERNSFVSAATKRSEQPRPVSEQVLPPGSKPEPEEKPAGSGSGEGGKYPENPDELVPDVKQIEYNPNVQRERILERNILVPPPYVTESK